MFKIIEKDHHILEQAEKQLMELKIQQKKEEKRIAQNWQIFFDAILSYANLRYNWNDTCPLRTINGGEVRVWFDSKTLDWVVGLKHGDLIGYKRTWSKYLRRPSYKCIFIARIDRQSVRFHECRDYAYIPELEDLLVEIHEAHKQLLQDKITATDIKTAELSMIEPHFS
jgi:hypothetical protein